MRREKTITVGEQPIAVRELTVGELRAWLADVDGQIQRDADGTPDVVGLWLLDDCSFGDLMRMSSVTREQMDAMTETDLRALVAACRELNPGFFGMRARLMAIGQQAMTTQQPAPETSPAPSAD